MHLSIALLAVCLSLPFNPARAQDDDELEAWQKRILRALEEGAEEGRDAAGDEGAVRAPDTSRQGYARPQPDDREATRAAEEARRRYGGRALAVMRVGDGFRVRLLLDNGRVMTVTIED